MLSLSGRRWGRCRHETRPIRLAHVRALPKVCLAAARRRVNVTQQELATRVGKPQSFVLEYERDQRRIDVVELLANARVSPNLTAGH
jgi:DNA-binding transcriptional regulator YiaG